jgi:ABC-type protease/lipase transport system fused ATPase/permease subunit
MLRSWNCDKGRLRLWTRELEILSFWTQELKILRFWTREIEMPRLWKCEMGIPRMCVWMMVQRQGQFMHETNESFVLTVPEFSVRKGEIVAVCGRVGAGKSSLIHAILGDMEKVRSSAFGTLGTLW